MNFPQYVSLSEEDQALAQSAAQARFQRRCNRWGNYHKWNRPIGDHTLQTELNSIASEIAVARVIGHQWIDPSEPDPEGDVGDGKQVRWTKYRSGVLPLHLEDNDDHYFFLVTGLFPSYRIVGWTLGRDGKKTEFWRELTKDRPCFCVPQDRLRKFF